MPSGFPTPLWTKQQRHGSSERRRAVERRLPRSAHVWKILGSAERRARNVPSAKAREYATKRPIRSWQSPDLASGLKKSPKRSGRTARLHRRSAGLSEKHASLPYLGAARPNTRAAVQLQLDEYTLSVSIDDALVTLRKLLLPACINRPRSLRAQEVIQRWSQQPTRAATSSHPHADRLGSRLPKRIRSRIGAGVHAEKSCHRGRNTIECRCHLPPDAFRSLMGPVDVPLGIDWKQHELPKSLPERLRLTAGSESGPHNALRRNMSPQNKRLTSPRLLEVKYILFASISVYIMTSESIDTYAIRAIEFVRHELPISCRAETNGRGEVQASSSPASRFLIPACARSRSARDTA